MDRDAVDRVVTLFESRGQSTASNMPMRRRLASASTAREVGCAPRRADLSELWESAFTTAYDAYRTAADAVVLSLGYRVPAVAKHWQPWGEIADLFVGRSDPDWDRDRDLIDQSLMNSWERAHESGA